ncbi:ATP-binding protein [Clostridium swellfunianum]|uniref:ATP-binding protein n=1 Tax=Clostridium swellfunianum TaxID=1367462 RepID=UPI00202EF1E8|nr:ATP-binding protein [Clostridium swellfunianum]
MEALSRIMQQIRRNSPALNQRSQDVLAKENEKPWRESFYKCSKCQDTGWIFTPSETSAPFAKSCECRELEKIKNQWKAAGINPEKSKQTFGSFEVWNDSSRKAKDTATAYYKDFQGISSIRRNSIMLCGQVGSGKTHLSIALALNFLNKGIKVVYMPYRDKITSLKQNMLDDEYYKKLVSKYQTCEVLLIDDLFKGKINDSDINIMFETINYRYLNQLPIIVSTEFTVEKLLTFDEAIGSRIYEMCKDYIVEVEKDKDNNYRLK